MDIKKINLSLDVHQSQANEITEFLGAKKFQHPEMEFIIYDKDSSDYLRIHGADLKILEVYTMPYVQTLFGWTEDDDEAQNFDELVKELNKMDRKVK